MTYDFFQALGPSEKLKREGYLVIEDLIDPELLQAVYNELDPHFSDAPFGNGHFYGPETKRFGRPLARSRSVEKLVLNKTVLTLVNSILGEHCDCLQLNLGQGIEIHPGAPAQGPHRDHDMWWGEKGKHDYMVNVMWALDDFTIENGATRIWPRSNHMLNDMLLPDDEAVSAVMPAGSACLFLGSTLHSGGANKSDKPRRGLVISYCLGWLKPWENQWLSYPPEVAKTFSPELADLVGYRQHRPSLNNFEGQCPSVLLQDGNWSPFVDALKPEQAELVAIYREMQINTIPLTTGPSQKKQDQSLCPS